MDCFERFLPMPAGLFCVVMRAAPGIGMARRPARRTYVIVDLRINYGWIDWQVHVHVPVDLDPMHYE